ncbi:carbon-nitrogen hydrolase family protein [Azospirillum sp. ST 5-10]|uniref:carbon-nitrogen hydrolase family protein n=1 Tax=unclassified Azospirillum TaxID=2630922 RepID=UPI003F4A552C
MSAPRVALWQTADGGLDRLERAAAAAARRGAGLLVAPEMALTGYAIGADAVRRLAEPRDGPAAARAAAIARRSGVALLYGYPERGADGAVYNAVRLVDADGTARLDHRKTHLYGDLDRAAFAPGDRLAPVVAVAGLRVGVLICYEVEFPELARRLARDGAELIAVPTALMAPYDVVARTVVPARAWENQLFVAYANRCGGEGTLTYCGLSAVVGPDARDRARADRGEELLVAAVDRAAIAAGRRDSPYLADLRPEVAAPDGPPDRRA